MANRIWLICVVLLFASCKGGKQLNHLTFVSYNVENLFDTDDDPHKHDNDFLPTSDKKWTPERYQKKLVDIARVLQEINPADMPEIIGLIEVENRKVLDDLVKTAPLLSGNYRIVHQEGPDRRGIDVALLYRPEEFDLITYEAIPVDPGFATRDILHVVGNFKRETFHFFVNHWPSRIGGQEKSEPARVIAAETLKYHVDRVLRETPEAHIVIMGDMNDEPLDKSLQDVLGAGHSGAALVNLMMPLDVAGKGTYFYRGHWNMLDNLVVSSNLLDRKGYQVKEAIGKIFQQPWIEYTSKKGEVSPNKTYGGDNYYGGVSDHFPVYLELTR